MQNNMKCMVAAVLSAAAMFTACTVDAPYELDNVTIKTEIVQVSAGFAEVRFTPSRNTWYMAELIEVIPDTDPLSAKKQFMMLAIDQKYMEYTIWRHDLLYNIEASVADFASHCLQYGDSDRFFQNLKPDTDYWLFSFVVDPKTNKPVGQLNFQTIHTKAASEIEMSFDYRIKGRWDYVYPRDAKGEILSTVPWIGDTVDSLHVVEAGLDSPAEYFAMTFAKRTLEENPVIFYGIYAHHNDGKGDGTSTTEFELGHTYYTGLALFDGMLSCYQIYKFTWTGEDMDVLFTPESSVVGW